MNISFSITTAQVERSFATGIIEKDVTRRNGWLRAKAGDILNACEKCQGIKKGEKVRVLGRIQIVNVRREKLRAMIDDEAYGRRECIREGFPPVANDDLHLPSLFVGFFCRGHKGMTPETVITRIEFAYLRPDAK